MGGDGSAGSSADRGRVQTTNSKGSHGVFPGDEVLNQAFTKSSLQIGLQKHQILHLATHGKFEPGMIEQSFLVLGDGNPFKIPDIQGLDGLTNVHLVVLSACETALGDRREQDGIEIAGISNAFLQRGAKTVIASLWQVNDFSTSIPSLSKDFASSKQMKLPQPL